MLVLFSLWQQVVWGGWGCSMRSLKKCSGVLDLTRLPPPLSIAIPRYITNWMLTCGAQRRAERQRDTCGYQCGISDFSNSFSRHRLLLDHRLKCVCLYSHLFHFRRRGMTLLMFFMYLHKVIWPMLFRGCELHFESPLLFIPSLCLVYLFHFQIDLMPLCALMLSRSWSVQQKLCISAATGRMFICFKHSSLFFCCLFFGGVVWLFFNHTIVSLMRLTSNCGAIIPPLTYFWQILLSWTRFCWCCKRMSCIRLQVSRLQNLADTNV